MSLKQTSNVDLIKRVINVSFLVANYPNNKLYPRQLDSLTRELCKRLGLSKEEIDEVLKGN